VIRTKEGTQLYGDWRRRRGTKTVAHLYAGGTARRPMCGKVIERHATDAVQAGVPCSECLVAAITAPR
jgi:hypothetical protein